MDKLLHGSSKEYNGAYSITIDDGLYDLYTVAYPTLIARGIPFTAFVSADLLDQEGYITTEQLKEMSKNPLVTIGSHGCTHRCLDLLSKDEQLYELSESKKKIETIIGKEVKYFAYSNGRFAKNTKRLVRKAGYKYAFGVVPRAYNIVSKNYRFELPRINLANETYNKIMSI